MLDDSESQPTEEVKVEEEQTPPAETVQPKKRGRKRKIIDHGDSPDVIKEKRKNRAIELKLNKLKWTLNQEVQRVEGKRQKKAPQRFELAPRNKRKSYIDECPEGRGKQLGSIAWIWQHLQNASLYTLRLLHRTIYRKQGMFSEKLIRKSVVKFRGFSFDGTHEEIRKRREQLEKTHIGALGGLCDLLALRRSSKENMIDRIIGFLLCPTQKSVDDYLRETRGDPRQLHKMSYSVPPFRNIQQKQQVPLTFLMNQHVNSADNIKELCTPYVSAIKIDDGVWKKPVFFSEGNGVKLKFIRTAASNIEMANDAFIELLHRLLYLHNDEKANMRRSILEFSGLKCEPGTMEYAQRLKILNLLPVDQVKLVCRVLGLPTWHKARQPLTDQIMDFLVAPRISLMKKRVPPHFTDEISFSFDTAKVPRTMTELKSDESEEIEIFPDIHILPDDDPPDDDCDSSLENEYLGVKLKNFSNIHYQVITTPAAKLNDLHMILYLNPSKMNSVRDNVLEFVGFPFDETTKEFLCRKSFMESLSLEDLKVVASVLCVSQYIVDESKAALIDAILKFLLKPSALLNSSTIMPTISPGPMVVKKKATSTIATPMQLNQMLPEIKISEVKTLANTSAFENSPSNAISSTISTPMGNQFRTSSEFERMKTCLSSDIQIIPVSDIKIEDSFEEGPTTMPSSIQILPISHSIQIKKDDSFEADVPLSKVKCEAAPTRTVTYVDSDDEDDRPLSKMIGHPNDDQLKALVTKIVKESKLEDITMKIAIKKVFDNYPIFDLGYRKEFIKSLVRQILSQMEDTTCSVTTTVINI